MSMTGSLLQTHSGQIFPSPETHSWFLFGFNFFFFFLKVCTSTPPIAPGFIEMGVE